MSWYRKAAEHGHADAQFNLGNLYANGEGVLQDYKETVSWYRKAAEQGHARAQAMLGYLYEKGEGVQQDFVIAYMLYNLAATQGLEPAITLRKLILDQMTKAQIDEAQSLSRNWTVGERLPIKP